MARYPKEFNQMRKILRRMERYCTKRDNAYCWDSVSDIVRKVNCGAWSWPPIVKQAPPENIDRCGDVLVGPVYTCKGYEWPIQNNFPMIPVIQLDLDRCSRVSRTDLGSGLLQVWDGFGVDLSSDAYIRVIPADRVHKKELLPVPFFDIRKMEQLGSKRGKYVWSPTVSIDWADPNYKGSRSGLATYIAGYGPRQFSFPDIDEIDIDINCGEEEADQELLSMEDELKALIRFAHEHWKDSGTQLMGTFDPIQYLPEEYPAPLFCLEDGPYYIWGDGGNAQVFFEKQIDGTFKYSFTWSCC